MRKLLKLVLVALGIRAFLQWRKGRRTGIDVGEPPLRGPSTSDPAEELRRKLAESREDEAAEPSPPVANVEDRRSDVHAQGRATLDEMSSPDEG